MRLPIWERMATSLVTSVISGMFVRVTGRSKRRVAGMMATAEFLEPDGVTSPSRT